LVLRECDASNRDSGACRRGRKVNCLRYTVKLNGHRTCSHYQVQEGGMERKKKTNKKEMQIVKYKREKCKMGKRENREMSNIEGR